jgi:hypothetical protein
MAKLLRARIPAARIVLAGAGMLVLLTSPAPLAGQSAASVSNVAEADLLSLPDAPIPAQSSTPESSITDSSSPEASSASDQTSASQPSTSNPSQAAQPPQAQQSLPKPNDQNQQQPAPPSLGDLGLSPSQTRPDPDLQARLDRHTRMLRIHQRLGLITLAPLAGACISSAFAPPDLKKGKDNATGRDIHVGLGAASVTMYAFTASYAIRAPRVSDEPAHGGIKLHKYLIWVHGPGMILTPILGAMAYDQANNGEKVHGIASAHAAVAWTTVAAYGAAIIAVSWPIHIGSLKL